MIVLFVKYNCKPGQRAAFLNEIEKNEIDVKSRAEAGCERYEYSYSETDDDCLVLNEIWKDEAAFASHHDSAHFQLLGTFKADYVIDSDVRRFKAEEFFK